MTGPFYFCGECHTSIGKERWGRGCRCRNPRDVYPFGMKYPAKDETLDEKAERRREFRRSGGDVLCTCGWEYRLHPFDTEDGRYSGRDDGFDWLHVLCDGSRVKL